jgi:ketosteroid isomerase-like protein
LRHDPPLPTFPAAFDPPVVRASPVSERPGDKTLSAGPAGPAQRTWREGSLASSSARDTAEAMSEENVALARKAIDALNRGDFDALLAFLSPDVVWEALEGVPGIAERYRGRAGVREWIALMWENAEEGLHIEIEQITDLGDDRVFIAVVLTARRRPSGVPFEYRTWQIVWFADGLITRRQVFWTRAEALKTAGLRE